MLTYLDSSVLLRVLFAEPTQLPEFRKITKAVSSDLLRVECLRTIDRIRGEKQFAEEEYLRVIELFYRFQEGVELIPVQREILNRACQPFPVSLGTLDAIHLASATLYRERLNSSIIFCTHDKSLRNAAMAIGFRTLG